MILTYEGKYMSNILKGFNRWMNYNPPFAETAKGWRLFNSEFKENAPIRYWIQNDLIRSVIWPIEFKINDMIEYVRFRTYDRYNVVDTGLPPNYYDISTMMLHANFNMLRNYIEVDKGLDYFWAHKDKYTQLPWYHQYVIFQRLFKPRYPALGIKYLEWESTLDSPELDEYSRSDKQAVTARELLYLYNWWVNERPTRKLMDNPSYDDQGFDMGPCDEDFDKSAEDYIRYKEISALNDQQEKSWEDEDTNNLIRLIKIRKSLW